jgi:hypothetical protein
MNKTQKDDKKSIFRKIWNFITDLINGISGALPF